MKKGFFGDLYDVNHDGELDNFERTMDYLAYEDLTRVNMEAEEDDDEFEDFIEMTGLDPDELSWMDEDEICEALEDEDYDEEEDENDYLEEDLEEYYAEEILDYEVENNNESNVFSEFGEHIIYNALKWDAEDETFIEHKLKIVFSIRKIEIYIQAFNTNIYSVDIGEGQYVKINLKDSNIKGKSILDIAGGNFLVDTEDAYRIKEYYDRYLDVLEKMDDEKQKRIDDIISMLNVEILDQLGRMCIERIEVFGKTILLRNDILIVLQRRFSYKKYRDVEPIDSDPEDESNITSAVAVVEAILNMMAAGLKELRELCTEEEIMFVCWDVVRRATVPYYAKKWEELYGKYIEEPLEQYSDEHENRLDRYLEKLILCDDIDLEDYWLFAYFTYYVMEKGYVNGDMYFPRYFSTVTKTVLAFKKEIE